MARRGGRRGRRRGRRGSTRSKASSSKSTKSKSRRRSTAASKRRRVRSVAKAKRARNTTKSTSSKSKSTGGSKGRSNNTRGGQAKANRNQNKKARRTVRSVKKAVSKVAKNVGKTARNVTRGLAAKAGTHLANSQYNKKLKQANWTKRDMSKLTPQQQRKYKRLSEKTGRDYSIRKPTFRLNLNADTIAKFGKFADKGWYKGLTNRFPGIKTLKINKQFYGNPMKSGWHSSQRTGRGQGLIPEAATRQQLAGLRADPSQDIGMMYQNILGREADQEGLDYWTNEFRSGRQNMDDIRRQLVQSDEFGGRSAADKSAVHKRLKEREMIRDKNEYTNRVGLPWFPDGVPVPGGQVDRPGLIPLPDRRGASKKYRRPAGPQQDWLGSLYRRHNISGGKLDQEARDYWSNEAKTKGRRATRESIIGTAKASGTYGGRKRPQRINTGSKRRGGGGILGLGAALAGSRILGGHYDRKGARRKANLQNKGAKRRMAKSLAAHIAATRGM